MSDLPPVTPTNSALKRTLRRMGCLLLFCVWLAMMTLPCFFITLLMQKEIILSRSDLPEHYFRLFLIDSVDNGGVGITRGDITDGSATEGKYCIKTSVTYLMWQGSAAPLAYCSCYEQIEGTWS